MRSFSAVAWATAVFAAALKVEGAVLPPPAPVITPAPSIAEIGGLLERDDPDAISLAQILLTALPASLRIIAATNVPAVSSILWREFLDDNRPDWFTQLPVDIQNYLIRHFGPSTAWPTATPTAPVSSAAETTQPSTSQSLETTSETASERPSQTLSSTDSLSSISTSDQATSSALSTSKDATTEPAPSSASSSSGGLSRNQKIGIGLGVPLAILGTAAILLGCCFLVRRRKQKSMNGSQPPSSPGFIPRFAFQEKGEHHTPLTSEASARHLSQDTTYSNAFNWDDDVIDPMEPTQMSGGRRMDSHTAPVLAPAVVPSLYHTHSSNRARGKRTSYSSLHSVAEVREPDESPVLPRDSFRPAAPRRLSSGLIPGVAQTKRKPIPSTSPRSSANSNMNPFSDRSYPTAIAAAAATALLRPSIPSNNNSDSTQSSSDPPSTVSPLASQPHIPPSPVSPLSSTSPAPAPFPKDPVPQNPFLNDYYVEDYGPEYTHVFPYDDLENGLYGGHSDFSRYPAYSQVTREAPNRERSKTEWPLRNALGGHRRGKSPLWDRVYDG